MSEVWENVLVAVGFAIFAMALVFWVAGFVSNIAMHRAFHRYMKSAHPELGHFRRSLRFNDLIWSPNKFHTELEADQTGAVDELFKWRQRLIFAITGFLYVIGGTFLLGVLGAFLAYVYVKGQQAG